MLRKRRPLSADPLGRTLAAFLDGVAKHFGLDRSELVKPYSARVRRHSPERVSQLAASSHPSVRTCAGEVVQDRQSVEGTISGDNDVIRALTADLSGVRLCVKRDPCCPVMLA